VINCELFTLLRHQFPAVARVWASKWGPFTTLPRFTRNRHAAT